MDLHPYDGKERRYRDSDANRGDGLSIVAKLLGLASAPAREDVRYDLSFYSGGIGVCDVLGMTYACSLAEFERIAVGLNAKDVAAAVAHPAWAEELLWLIDADGISPSDAAARFVLEEKLDFQAPCTPSSPIRFVVGSGVNDWTVLWFESLHLNYRGYSQG
jgi:hypothetical protein